MALAYELIARTTVGSGGAANIEFTSIPGTYADLLIKLSARITDAGIYYTQVSLRPNGSTSNLSSRYLFGNGAAAGSATFSTVIDGWGNPDGSTSNTFGNCEFYIPNYTGSANKSVSIDVVTENNNTYALNAFVAGLWANSAAITSITVVPNSGDPADKFKQYTTATLYGIKNTV